MKKWMTVTFATITGLVLLLFVIPFFIPLETYKPLITQEMEAKLGRRVSLDGGMRLSFLPTPHVVVKGLKIATGEGGRAPFMVELPKVRVDLGVGALFHKQIKLTQVKIYTPTIHLETLPNGEGNWIFHEKKETPVPVQAPGEEKPAGSSFDLAVDEVEILRATLVWHNDQGEEERLEDLSTMLSMETLMGPMDARGAFKALGRDIEFRLSLKKFTEKTPIKLTLATKGVDASLKGNLLIDQKTFEGDLSVKSDLDDLEKLFGAETQIPEFLREPFSITGFVALSAQGAEVKHLELVMEDKRLEGSGQVNLEPLSFTCDMRGLPGGVNLHMTGSPRKGGLSGSAALSVRSARKFLEWTRLVEVKTMPASLVDAAWDMTTEFVYDAQGVNLKNLMVKADEASLSGGFSFGIAQKRMTYDLALTASQAFLKNVGAPLKTDLTHVGLKGTTRFVDFEPLKIETDTTLNLPQGTLSAKGNMNVGETGAPHFDMLVRASAGEGISLSQGLRLQNLQLSTSLQGDTHKMQLGGVKASLVAGGEKMTLEGGLALEIGPKLNVTGQLHASPMNMDRLFAAGQKEARELMPRIMLVAHKKREKHDETPRKEGSAPHAWSRDPMDFSWITQVDAQVTFTCPRVVWSDWSMEKIQKTVKIMEGVLTSEATGTIWDGKFSSAFSLTNPKSPELKLRMALDDASVKKALSKVDTGKFKIVQGKLEQLTNLRTQGKSMWDFVSNLEGTVSLDVENGVVAGVDLKSLSDKIGDLRNLQGLTTLFAGTLNQGTTTFSQAKVALEFHKGVGRIGKLLVHTDAAEVTGGGTVDVPHYTLDANATMRLTQHPDFPPFTVRFSGPLDAPERSYDVSQIQAYMLQNVFSKLLSGTKAGKIGDVISGVLGGGGAPSDNTQNQQDSSQDKGLGDIAKEPAKAIGGLLKGLL